MGLISVSRPLGARSGGDVPAPWALPDGEVYDQHVNDAAGIQQSKLALEIMDSDIAHNAKIDPTKINLTGSKVVVGSESSLMVICGTISTQEWTPLSGEGFGWSPQGGDGAGKINFFPTVFASAPSITVSPLNPIGVDGYVAPQIMVDYPSLTGQEANVSSQDAGTTDKVHSFFSFQAIGVRF